MSNAQHAVVDRHSFLTLHYRLASADGVDIISTFNERPATIQLGTDQLAPFLEAVLIGLPEGADQTFELPPERAFGSRNPELVQRVSRAMLKENSSMDENYALGDLVEFAAPSGGQFAGVLREINDVDALFDFNHPLAGQTVTFQVRIIGVL